ncbi:MAG: CDGSH iron-sulfur domain-containing protein, partial [Acidobacteria bacterium]|nr:CDGSH iron-sulfur domain-containing protein [Acidobacteriota bacterium]
VVEGPARVLDGNGVELEPSRLPIALCRCGRTGTPPFCDGSHRAHAGDGTAAAESAHAESARTVPAHAVPAAVPPDVVPPDAVRYGAGPDRQRQGTAATPTGEAPDGSAAWPPTPSGGRPSGRG